MSYFWTAKQTFIERTNRFCSGFSTETETFIFWKIELYIPNPFVVKLDLKNEVGSYCWSVCIRFPFICFFALPTEAPGYCLCSCHGDGATFQWWGVGGGGGPTTSQKVFCLFHHTPPRQQQQINLRYFQLRIVKCCHKNTLLLAAELWIWLGGVPKHVHVGSNGEVRQFSYI